MILTWVGWVGSLMLAVCALPEAYFSWRNGQSHLSWALLGLWGGGELLTFAYVIPRLDWPLVFNYGTNILALCIICWYKWRPRKALP